jgi:hypothetical protein
LQSHTCRYKQNELGIPRIIVLFFPKADNAIFASGRSSDFPFYGAFPLNLQQWPRLPFAIFRQGLQLRVQSRFFTGVPFSSRNLVFFREPNAVQM